MARLLDAAEGGTDAAAAGARHEAETAAGGAAAMARAAAARTRWGGPKRKRDRKRGPPPPLTQPSATQPSATADAALRAAALVGRNRRETPLSEDEEGEGQEGPLVGVSTEERAEMEMAELDSEPQTQEPAGGALYPTDEVDFT